MTRFSPDDKPALLALANGMCFEGTSVGAPGAVAAEVVFNTSITGYQEILTDPSYAQQIITLTYPHIGNVGVNADDWESDRVSASGLIIRDLSPVTSNWRSTASLQSFLLTHNVVAISDIDTRALVHVLRDQGAQAGCIMTDEIDQDKAIAMAASTASLAGQDLTSQVTTKQPYVFQQPSLSLSGVKPKINSQQHMVVYDLGVKRQILHCLVDRGCRLTVVPANTPVDEVLALQPDGVVLSNGPGDPAACDALIAVAQQLMQQSVPLLGICLGYQIIGLACGARTIKMTCGHHGANHPVQCLTTGKVCITSQNHGFAIDRASLPSCLKATYVSLFDQTLQGFCHQSLPVLGFQGHPEASPGPQDISAIFDNFVTLVTQQTSGSCQKDKI